MAHFVYQLMFERALQAVNPSVTLPYWDFTLESTLYNPDTFRQSRVFSEDWFGDAAPDNALHSVEKGRFAQVPVMKHATNFSALVSPHGLLRSPVSVVQSCFALVS